MSEAIAYDPCFSCNRKEMCHLCELEMHRSGSISTQKWISVEDRLPKSDERVLVYMRENRMSYTRIDTDRMVKGKWVRWETCVTHWMPLPDAPKMKGENNG